MQSFGRNGLPSPTPLRLGTSFGSGGGSRRRLPRQEQAEAHDLCGETLQEVGTSLLTPPPTLGSTILCSSLLLQLPGFLPALIAQSVA